MNEHKKQYQALNEKNGLLYDLVDKPLVYESL